MAHGSFKTQKRGLGGILYVFWGILVCLVDVRGRENVRIVPTKGETCFAGTIYYNELTRELQFAAGVIDVQRGVATGLFTDGLLHKSNFGELRISTNAGYPDDLQAYAAGYIEGVLTRKQIYQSFHNMKCFISCSGKPPLQYKHFMNTQESWMRIQIVENPTDPYWVHAKNIVRQYDGIIKGYNAESSKEYQLSKWAFQMLNAIGDANDLNPKFNKSKRVDYRDMDAYDEAMYQGEHGHCSALIKLTGNFSDLLVGHSSWYDYSDMIRIYKHYDFQFQQSNIASHKTTFSSYPGMLSSLDDFYLMDSGLAMIQTSFGLLNNDLYSKIKPYSMLAWHRVRIANDLASTGQEWYHIFKRYNSGTYNNQYMVVDYNRFEPGNALKPGLLWIVEQIPGTVHGEDCTQELQFGYWPSYNVPFFPIIYYKSGYGEIDKLHGQSFGSQYQLAPRANILRRDADTVTDMNSFELLLRSNNYEHDPYAKGDQMSVVCSRGDLANESTGCFDTKVTNYSMFWKMQSFAVNGPTTSNGLSPFSWSNTNLKVSHEGEATTFNFTFELLQPNWEQWSKELISCNDDHS